MEGGGACSRKGLEGSECSQLMSVSYGTENFAMPFANNARGDTTHIVAVNAHKPVRCCPCQQ